MTEREKSGPGEEAAAENKDRKPGHAPQADRKQARNARLSAALRENLKRRKQQARKRRQDD